MTRTLKTLGVIFTAFAVLLGAWLLISFFDIVSHNINGYRGYGDYLDWNFFTVLEQIIRG